MADRRQHRSATFGRDWRPRSNRIQADSCVRLRFNVYTMDRARHTIWLTTLGLLGLLYCPVIHVISRRSTWATADWIAALVVTYLIMTRTIRPKTIPTRAEETARVMRWNYEGATIVVRLSQYAGSQAWEPLVSLEDENGSSIDLGSPFDDSIFKTEKQAYVMGLAHGRKCVDDAMSS